MLENKKRPTSSIFLFFWFLSGASVLVDYRRNTVKASHIDIIKAAQLSEFAFFFSLANWSAAAWTENKINFLMEQMQSEEKLLPSETAE